MQMFCEEFVKSSKPSIENSQEPVHSFIPPLTFRPLQWPDYASSPSQILPTCPIPAPQSPAAVCPRRRSRSVPGLRSHTSKCWSWRRSSTTTSTCRPPRGLSWPVHWDWPRPRWKSGSRTAATRPNGGSKRQNAARTCTKWSGWSSRTICRRRRSSAASAGLINTDPTCGTTMATGGLCYGEAPKTTAAAKSPHMFFAIACIGCVFIIKVGCCVIKMCFLFMTLRDVFLLLFCLERKTFCNDSMLWDKKYFWTLFTESNI